MTDQIFVGRRKTSVARVILRNGDGKIKINDKDFELYFPQKTDQLKILTPFNVTETASKYDLVVNVNGGGFTGQVEAVRLGITRALVSLNSDFKPALKKEGLLTRDPRMVERKKYGRPKARKRFQFSKR